MPIKFLFINSVNIDKEIQTYYPALGIGYLVSMIRKRFGQDAVDCKVIDRDVENQIHEFMPDIVGISSVSQNYNKAVSYAAAAKKYGLPVICGGVHISMAPYSLSKDMDIGVLGEGEETIGELMDLYIKKGKFPDTELNNIKGIIYWNGTGKISFTEKRQLIFPLDSIPYPARDVLSILPNTYMFTSRGCPYRCAFCASSRFWDKVRLFSAEYVAGEIEHLIGTYTVKEINFQDDLFTLDKARINRILQLLKEKKLIGRVAFSGAIRANLVEDKIISLLKEMGFYMLGLGLESGCEDTLAYLKGDSVNIKDNEKAVKIIKKHGIQAAGSFIIGAPYEDKSDVLKTLRFIEKQSLDKISLYVLTPFPGTPVWDYALSKGLVREDMNWDRLNVDFQENHDAAIIVSEKLTKEELYALYLRFKQYLRKKEFYAQFKNNLKHPLVIPGFIFKKITKRIKRWLTLPN